ncbi:MULTISPECIES: carbon-nitrogen hydrolase family protein [unclassified Methylocaldum]|uniref:carbon-nitrogen hydrolase family protein n=1 Tax=unclassified Methylocaldum TaxID=2622260 RepID=UPI00098B1D00|nr:MULTISPECIES: carbon-nitrogen hydrolase family protein [unclassified Methylocaldum]MBP1151044.1 putative amidohydrolase [Methylocaldum sp. RMAD-M]
MPSQAFLLAAAQYNIGFLKSWDDYSAKIARWVADAADNGAKMLLFPEYFSMELASLFPEEVYKSLSKQLSEMQTLLPDFVMLFSDMAEQHGVHIVAGSFPVRMEDGSYRNRSFLFRPDGTTDHQDKLQMTRFENEHWLITGGEEIKTLDTEFGRIGINICYDSEFPMIARKQVEAGADLILVPSCTDTLAGYHRVRIGCQARALENQCYIVQSPTVGQAPWSEAVDVNIGAAAVYTPVDYGYPDNGILAIGELNQAQWVYAEIDLASIAHIRQTGQVFNYRDWPGQFRYV